ncbi:hypothetical protein A2335_04850 [Candidatus Peregrinibacteria bacterium RIFOXYB2_FULL_32_7]|nr:MAG: hypothetical protein A2335_04850 [Candidatus Peregrinibacteria bacterium RIFOXYB2_FULL_32_7]
MCYEIQKIINSFWQDNRGRPPKVASFKKNKIVIKCGSSSCMQELEMLKLEILNKIQEKNFDKKVTDLRFALD